MLTERGNNCAFGVNSKVSCRHKSDYWPIQSILKRITYVADLEEQALQVAELLGCNLKESGIDIVEHGAGSSGILVKSI